MEEKIEYNDYTIEIRHDEWCDSPTDWGNYEIKEFRTSDERDEFVDDDIELAKQLVAGTTLWLDKYEHSGVSFSLSGEGMQCRWDTSSRCALLIMSEDYALNADSTPESLRELARSSIGEYNQWLDGDVYRYVIYDGDGEEIDNLSGIYGYGYALDEAKGCIDCEQARPLSERRYKAAANAQSLHN